MSDTFLRDETGLLDHMAMNAGEQATIILSWFGYLRDAEEKHPRLARWSETGEHLVQEYRSKIEIL
ncbi:MAG: hypothetical protein AAGJ50_11135 [Pseudomonadota bacterium]